MMLLIDTTIQQSSGAFLYTFADTDAVWPCMALMYDLAEGWKTNVVSHYGISFLWAKYG
jgi:hypothetical protein